MRVGLPLGSCGRHAALCRVRRGYHVFLCQLEAGCPRVVHVPSPAGSQVWFLIGMRIA